jgi:hypothetical protein
MTPEPEEPKPSVRIVDSLWTFAVAVAFIGPFALPLLWRNPRFRVQTKVILSIIVIVFTAALILGAADLTQMMLKQISGLRGL